MKQDSNPGQFFKNFARDYLGYLGNSNPGHKQITDMQASLKYTWIKHTVCFDIRLTVEEKRCLYLAAEGKTLSEIADFMKVSTREIEECQQSIFEKLGCNSIQAAVALGIGYGEITCIKFGPGS